MTTTSAGPDLRHLPDRISRQTVAAVLGVGEDLVARRLDPILKPRRVGLRRVVYDKSAVLAYLRGELTN